MDRHLARILGALEKKVGNDYLLAVTADHGMPSEPSSGDRRHFAPSIIDLLNNEFDPEGKQLVTAFEPENLQIFIDEDRLSKLGLTLPELATFLKSQPFLFWAFTNDEVRRAAMFHLDEKFIAAAKAHGFDGKNLDKLLRLRMSGLLDE